MVLDKVLKFVITALMAIIGLVLMNLLSPYLKTIISAEFLSMGIFGVAMTTVLSVLLGGVIGGIIGLFLVWLISIVLTKALDFDFFLSVGNMILGTSLAAVIGLISGIVPAISASRLDPVEAIRTGI